MGPYKEKKGKCLAALRASRALPRSPLFNVEAGRIPAMSKKVTGNQWEDTTETTTNKNGNLENSHADQRLQRVSVWFNCNIEEGGTG